MTLTVADSSRGGVSKSRRHAIIEEILSTEIISSQPELQDALEKRGISVAQATLSRDLIEVRATKVRDASGRQIYALATHVNNDMFREEAGEQKLKRWAEELLVGVAPAQNLLVLRTPAGAANFLASAIDAARYESVVGCVAGDDTILVICTSAETAQEFADKLLSFGK
ncbi:arginine repressor [Gleimia coleocanis DSM 15436]|uniref:Arginine repressor n=1 Tax=Gleimia coleocanis DSM 15436 TaxID=525245 RepID=C0W1E6_9ACTO|nr:arginine repressor [Gleimia coleocanis]EEH63519.1 arginine repressor [Gleimia coleocanis DSM 15436]